MTKLIVILRTRLKIKSEQPNVASGTSHIFENVALE